MKITAIANSNIALIKYWGKRNDELILPQNSSVSVTLEGLKTITTAEFDEKYDKDSFVLDGKEATGKKLARVVGTLDLVRKMTGSVLKAKIVSENHFPTAAGLASSAAGGAALALAATKAAGLNLDNKELSIIARQNSGSASRSIEGGFVIWERGTLEDGSDCYGKQIVDADHWPEFSIIVTVLKKGEKKIKSRVGMKRSIETCPYYKFWVSASERQAAKMKELVLAKNFSEVGKLAEHSALMLHSVMFSTIPSIIYWTPETVKMILVVQQWREDGLECYFTIDGGPQMKIICLEKDIIEIEKRLKVIEDVEEIYVCRPGKGAQINEKHLF